MATSTKLAQVLDLVRTQKLVQPRDLIAHDIPADYLDRLHRRGLIERIGRGLYAWPGAEVSEYHSLVEVSKQVPRGVICLLSALRFHGLTTQSPFEVWLALPPKAHSPTATSVGLRVVRFSGAALSGMIEEHAVEGQSVRVYSAAKTVADCFKFRNQVGLDVALEALRDCLRAKRASVDELVSAAKVTRMTNVMRPYLESVV